MTISFKSNWNTQNIVNEMIHVLTNLAQQGHVFLLFPFCYDSYIDTDLKTVNQ